jgi:hypothetical protein
MKAMNTSEMPNQEQPKKSRFPHWVTPIYLTVLFLLIHVAAPWGLSLLSTRYGWVGGRPGAWNLLALLLVAAGIAGTLWMIALHYLASPLVPGAGRNPNGADARRMHSRAIQCISASWHSLGWALFMEASPC